MRGIKRMCVCGCEELGVHPFFLKGPHLGGGGGGQKQIRWQRHSMGACMVTSKNLWLPGYEGL